ncbi:MAG: HNH endonuclease [Deltaproteobacteria bacterium]|nr:HNH endonuclease [Deltaproteobacteria bacterium]
MLSTNVLVLNRNYIPIDITSVRRAFILLYQEVAHVVDEQYRTFDFISWSDLSVEAHHESVGLINRLIRVPRVILLQTYDKLPHKTVRFSRMNIFLRDQNTCQYCGQKFSKSELNLDHVIPRSQGGTSRWENVVCSCFDCNCRKGGRTPTQAKMKLLRKPLRPRWSFLLNLAPGNNFYQAWKPFINIVDYSYWNTEIEP